ncbi:MAG: hypothetical protein V1787_04230 [Candidatus Micrarchaeota archaeon]
MDALTFPPSSSSAMAYSSVGKRKKGKGGTGPTGGGLDLFPKLGPRTSGYIHIGYDENGRTVSTQLAVARRLGEVSAGGVTVVAPSNPRSPLRFGAAFRANLKRLGVTLKTVASKAEGNSSNRLEGVVLKGVDVPALSLNAGARTGGGLDFMRKAGRWTKGKTLDFAVWLRRSKAPFLEVDGGARLAEGERPFFRGRVMASKGESVGIVTLEGREREAPKATLSIGHRF